MGRRGNGRAAFAGPNGDDTKDQHPPVELKGVEDEKLDSVNKGDRVIVMFNFMSDSRKSEQSELEKGAEGTIIKIDGEGDLEVKFGDLEMTQWVKKKHFKKLRWKRGLKQKDLDNLFPKKSDDDSEITPDEDKAKTGIDDELVSANNKLLDEMNGDGWREKR